MPCLRLRIWWLNMALLGIDFGEKRIGVALADGPLAVPLTTIDSAGLEADLGQIIALALEYSAELIVVGLPQSMDGSIGRQAEKVLEFAEVLAHSTDIPVDTWDERLSTVAAERMMREAGAKRDKLRANLDAMAAVVVLQAYIDNIGQ